MKRICKSFISLFQRQYIRTRFLIVMILLSVLPLILLGIISFNIAKNTMSEKHVETNQNHLETINDVADLMFDNVIKLHRLILSNSRLQQELKVSAKSEDGERGVIGGNDPALQIQRIMSQYFIDQNNINSVCLIDNRYRAVCYGRSDNLGIYEGNTQDVVNSDWHQEIVRAKGKEVFFSHNVLLGDDVPSSTFSTVKLLLDPNEYPFQKLGILIVNLDKKVFSKMLPDESNHFTVQDENNQTIFDSRNNNDRYVNPRSLEELQNQGYLITNAKNTTTNWTFATAVSPEVLFKETHEISRLTITIVLIISLASIILSIVLSKSITKPLAKIKRMMLDWSKGKKEFKEQFQDDEIGVIAETFKKVSWENDELNRRVINLQLKEREAELRILQSQINPHFLYNTLDSIYWMAIIEKQDNIAQMAISLSESFKLALNRGKETMPIEKELEHIRHYITIQNIRYGDRIDFIEEVDKGLLDKEILKLLLQPIIENAVFHGVEPKIGKGLIKIIGKLEGSFVRFTISDNGVGIEDLNLIEQGFGMKNVRERIELYYGSTSEFIVKSEVNAGTTITIRFPLNKEGHAHA